MAKYKVVFYNGEKRELVVENVNSVSSDTDSYIFKGDNPDIPLAVAPKEKVLYCLRVSN